MVIVFILIFAMTGKNTMENSKKANGMQKYRLYGGIKCLTMN
jgi:hypothetical protein